MPRSAPACWALWIGPPQWADLPGAFGAGQEGWVQLADVPRRRYIFSPDLPEGGAGYRVLCSAEDFLLLAFHEPETT